jgi:RimJ/RimL family protein N-acetyltransferase
MFYADWRASVACWLAPEARGPGAANRAVRLMTRWAFETQSDGVVRRVGFVEEGVLRSRHPCRGEYRDVRCFSLLRGE